MCLPSVFTNLGIEGYNEKKKKIITLKRLVLWSSSSGDTNTTKFSKKNKKTDGKMPGFWFFKVVTQHESLGFIL